jgi:hypothetical protein
MIRLAATGTTSAAADCDTDVATHRIRLTRGSRLKAPRERRHAADAD